MNPPLPPERVDDEDLLGRLVDDFTDRLNRGESPDIEACASEHPQIAELLRELLSPLLAMHTAKPARLGQERVGPSPLPERIGPYRILSEIDRGGMGVVYRAEHEQLRRRVALKVLLRNVVGERFRKRFQREARAAAKLHHTHIVPIYEAGESDGIHYIAMQHIDGRSLDRILRERIRWAGSAEPPVQPGGGATPHDQGALTNRSTMALRREPAETGVAQSLTAPADHQPASLAAAAARTYFLAVARIGRQAADALAYAHSNGVLHRDIKPSNLLVDQQGAAWVTDFGLAKTADENLTLSGDILGTLRYMAPERFRGAADQRSDVYGLGVTLYELLTLRPAFVESDRLQLIRQITDDEPPRPRTIDRNIPTDLETIVLKAMAKEPGARYASAAALAGDLERFLENRPITARRASVMNYAWHWMRRNPAVAGLGASIALVFLVGFAATWWQWRRAEGNLAQLERQQTLSQESFRQARHAVDDIIDAVNDESLLGDPSLRPVRRRLLQQALTYYQGFISRRGDDPSARAELVESRAQIARIIDVLGSPDAGLAARNEMLDATQQRVRNEPDSVQHRLELASVLSSIGNKHFSGGDIAEAQDYYQRAVAVCDGVLSEHGDNVDALAALTQAHLDLSQLHSRLDANDLRRRHLDQSRETCERLVQIEPENPRFTFLLASTYVSLGIFHNNRGHSFSQALTFLERAKAIYQDLARNAPDNSSYRANIGRVCNLIGDVYLLHRPDDEWSAHALKAFTAARQIEEEAVRASPQSRLLRQRLANTFVNLGEVHQIEQRWASALECFRQACDMYQVLTQAGASVEDHSRFAGASRSTAVCLERLGRDDEALAGHNQAVAEFFVAVRAAPDVPRYRRYLHETLRHRSALCARLDVTPRQDATAVELFTSTVQRARLFKDAAQTNSAAEFFRLALEMYQQLPDQTKVQQTRLLNEYSGAVRLFAAGSTSAPPEDAEAALYFALAQTAVPQFPELVAAGWRLERAVAFGGVRGAHHHPRDGLLYVGRGGTNLDGLYRIELDGTAARVAPGHRVSGVAVDPGNGDIFASEHHQGVIFRVPFGVWERATWVSGFHTGDDDPENMAVAPAGYVGPFLSPGDALVVDQGFAGPAAIYRFSTRQAEGEEVVYFDAANRRLVSPVDVTIDAQGVHVVDTRDSLPGCIWRLERDGALVELATSEPLDDPVAITTDPVTLRLLVLEASQGRLLSVDRTSGAVHPIATGLVLAPDFVDPRVGCRAALDATSDGAQVFFTNVTEHNVGVIYTLTRSP